MAAWQVSASQVGNNEMDIIDNPDSSSTATAEAVLLSTDKL